MRRAWVIAGLLMLALALRAFDLGDRPLHHDESNQAVRCGTLLESGEYTYDPGDHHGPTLYYLALPLLRLQAGSTFAEARIETLRGLVVMAGVALVVSPLLMQGAMGWGGALAAGLLLALSPAMVYYSRFFIQEMLFVLFVGIFLGGLWQSISGGGWRAGILLGVGAGLMQATKETCIIVFACVVLAGIVTLAAEWRTAPRRQDIRRWAFISGVAAVTALTLSVVFYSSFFTHAQGFVDGFRAYGRMMARGTGATEHVNPWYFYLRILAFWRSGRGPVWSEGAILVLAAVGAWCAIRGHVPNRGWGRFLGVYACLTLLVFTLIPYKTPWNVCVPLHGLVLLAGLGVAALLQRKDVPQRLAVCLALTLACLHLGWQAWRAAFPYAADPRNPYVYAHTSRDFLGAVKRIEDAAAFDKQGRSMRIDVITNATDAWPLPWYLRAYDRVGFFPPHHVPQEAALPVIVSVAGAGSAELAEYLGDRYITSLWQLRPGTFITVSVRRDRMEQIAAANIASQDS